YLPHDDLVIPPREPGRRSNERSGFPVLAMEFVAELIDAVERELGGELILHRDCPPDVQGEGRFCRIGEFERDAPPLDESTVDVMPFDVEKPGSGDRLLKTIDDFDRLVRLDGWRQQELIDNRRFAEQ